VTDTGSWAWSPSSSRHSDGAGISWLPNLRRWTRRIRSLAAGSDETPASALPALPAAPSRRPRPATAPIRSVVAARPTRSTPAGGLTQDLLRSHQPPRLSSRYQHVRRVTRPDLFHRASALGIPALVVRPADPGLTGHLPGITIVKPFGHYRSCRSSRPCQEHDHPGLAARLRR
jgi:hypothetical protein